MVHVANNSDDVIYIPDDNEETVLSDDADRPAASGGAPAATAPHEAPENEMRLGNILEIVSNIMLRTDEVCRNKLSRLETLRQLNFEAQTLRKKTGSLEALELFLIPESLATLRSAETVLFSHVNVCVAARKKEVLVLYERFSAAMHRLLQFAMANGCELSEALVKEPFVSQVMREEETIPGLGEPAAVSHQDAANLFDSLDFNKLWDILQRCAKSRLDESFEIIFEGLKNASGHMEQFYVAKITIYFTTHSE